MANWHAVVVSLNERRSFSRLANPQIVVGLTQLHELFGAVVSSAAAAATNEARWDSS